jgi:hypothetical protein
MMNGDLQIATGKVRRIFTGLLFIGIVLLFASIDSLAASNLPLGIVLRIEGEAKVKVQSGEQLIRRGTKLYDGTFVTVDEDSRLVILDLESKSRIIIPDPAGDDRLTQDVIRFTYQADFETLDERNQAAKATLKKNLTQISKVVSRETSTQTKRKASKRDTSSTLTRNIALSLEDEIQVLRQIFGSEDDIDFLWALHYLYVDFNEDRKALKTLEGIETLSQND